MQFLIVVFWNIAISSIIRGKKKNIKKFQLRYKVFKKSTDILNRNKETSKERIKRREWIC